VSDAGSDGCIPAASRCSSLQTQAVISLALAGVAVR